MLSIEQGLNSVLKPIFSGSKKEFLMVASLIKNWEEIVGKKYAKLCYPKSVHFRKDKALTQLTIGVYNPAVGFFLENNSEIILERIAISYGFKSISKIIIKQEPQRIYSSPKAEKKLPKAKEEKLLNAVRNVEDQDLVDVLARLGREVL